MARVPFSVGDELVFNNDDELVAQDWRGISVSVIYIDASSDTMTVAFNEVPSRFSNHVSVGDTGDYPLIHATRYFRRPERPPKFDSVDEARRWMEERA